MQEYIKNAIDNAKIEEPLDNIHLLKNTKK